jgi:hypothetical protein
VAKPKTKRFLGVLDAQADPDFKSHFIESNDLKRILSEESDVIYGSKGVGKTALRRALVELKESYFYTTKTFDFDEISFKAVYADLLKLHDTTKTEIPTLAARTWRNVLALCCVEAVAENLSESNSLRIRIDILLHKEKFKEANSYTRLTGQIENFLNRIAEAGLEDNSPAPLGLTQKQKGVVNQFPSTPEMESVLKECSQLVERSGKRVLICLDGFDSIVQHDADSRRAIFAGLIGTIHKLSNDKLLSQAFCFKAFLPQELTDEARSIFWDSDKHLYNTHYLRWTESDFQNFLLKRLLPYSRKSSSHFPDIWNECMPDKVRNDSHSTEEMSFSYILRHTLYRPRQLLYQVQMILEKWDETSDSFRVDPSFIPPVVANNNVRLAKSVVDQLELKHPGLSRFLQSWSGTPITVSVTDFQDRISRILGYSEPEDVNNAFDDLFNFGIFGYASSKQPVKGSQQTHFKFAFVGDLFERDVNTSWEENKLLALSPMFREYCRCTPSEFGIVLPVDQ